MLADNAFFCAASGDTPQLLSSASSKTAHATAARLALRPNIEVVGLTSAANVAFCESTGVYHRLLRYDQLDTLPADVPCLYLDFAGNGALRLALHSRFGALAYSCSIGGTHVEQLGGGRDLPGPRATLFFAPTQAKKRSADWGAAEFNRRLVADWRGFVQQVGQQVSQQLAAGGAAHRRSGRAAGLRRGAGWQGQPTGRAHAELWRLRPVRQSQPSAPLRLTHAR